MKFCGECGAGVTLRVPAGDRLPRYVCDACGWVHYVNPRLVVGCVPQLDGGILLCRRSIEPRRGYWTIPAGYMETGETLQEAAARESMEEAHARVRIGKLLAIAHLLNAEEVHVVFRAQLESAEFGIGAESQEVALYPLHAIPWHEIAFSSVAFALRCLVDDTAAGHEQYHFTTFDARLPSGERLDWRYRPPVGYGAGRKR
ncbi:MAG TPA: NUDIX hydrolase [Steroidobacter sp.]|uniref:NUDIX hydrolase n=1 Tax=Steroidobacter sp. TaxID=1978227 RepID=UPI002ED97A73